MKLNRQIVSEKNEKSYAIGNIFQLCFKKGLGGHLHR